MAHTTDQLNAALSGRYAIERKLGEGGMASVYLARDVKHDRRVALKVLKPELGAVLGVERFLAEIRVTANLQHPNLLPLFDSGEAGGLLYYVMPYVEGESLRQLIDREKQLPVGEAVRLSGAIAAALDYAHRHGVIHRDLKPENILLQDGQPLVADFGIALAISNAGGTRITQTGLSLGTPQYMSPEQATGDRQIDGRTDIYSLGAVTYEMLTGEPPHVGTTAQAIIARVLTENPRPVRATRTTVPAHVEAAVMRALAKLPADRWQTARDFADVLAGRSAVTSAHDAANVASRTSTLSPRARGVIAALCVALVAALAAAALGWREYLRVPARVTTRFVINTRANESFTPVNGVPVVLLPGGRGLVYSGHSPQGSTQLYYRAFDDLNPRPIPGTENSSVPFAAPDGRSVGFGRGYSLFSASLAGGGVTKLVDLGGNPRSPSWAPNGDIFIGSSTSILRLRRGRRQVDTLTRATPPDSSSARFSHGTPTLLPDGQTLVFWMREVSRQEERLGVLHLSTGVVDTLDGAAANPLGVVDGYLLFGRSNGTINAVPFEAGKTKTVADAIPVVEDALWRTAGGVVATVSREGNLAYARGSATTRLTIVDERGIAVAGDTVLREYANPAFSPDGRRIAVAISAGGGADIWTYEIAAGVLTRLTQQSNASNPARTAWTPDGSRVAYVENNAGISEAWWVPADGSGAEERLAGRPASVSAIGFSRDGALAFFQASSRQAGWDIWVRQMSKTGRGADSAAHAILNTAFNEIDPALSPDGHLIAYASNESGTYQVYVRRFPSLGDRMQVSVSGGTRPQWANDGRLFFATPNDSLIVATVVAQPKLTVASRRALFELPSAAYSVSPDGKRFAILRGGAGDQEVVVVLNWINELRAKMAAVKR